MAAALLPDPLWDLVEPFLPIPPRRPKGGRPRVSDRACLTGILFVLRSCIPWQMLPQELGCGSGMTCWRRLHDWQQAGVCHLIHFALLDWLARQEQIDWSRAVVNRFRPRSVCGRPDRSESHRSGQARKQASCDLRRAGRAPRRPADRRQSKRLARSTGLGGCDFPHFKANAVDRAGDRTVHWGIAATTRRRFGVGCAGVGFARSWRGVARGTGVASGGGGGWSRADVCVAESISPLAGAV